MKKAFYFILRCSSVCLLINQPAFATSWPIFMPPDKQTLLKLNYIETNQCPNGQGRLAVNPFINIRQHLCKNFCPPDWTWVANSDGKCHDLSSFNFKNYEVSHISDEYGTDYSVVTVTYGPKNTNNNDFIFKYSLTTQPGERWYCITLDEDTPLLSCANDMRR